jgi:hypothetical protein
LLLCSSYLPLGVPQLTGYNHHHQLHASHQAARINGRQRLRDTGKERVLDITVPYQKIGKASADAEVSCSAVLKPSVISQIPPPLQPVVQEVVEALAPKNVGDVEAPIIHSADPGFQKFVQHLAKSRSDKSFFIQNKYIQMMDSIVEENNED